MYAFLLGRGWCFFLFFWFSGIWCAMCWLTLASSKRNRMKTSTTHNCTMVIHTHTHTHTNRFNVFQSYHYEFIFRCFFKKNVRKRTRWTTVWLFFFEFSFILLQHIFQSAYTASRISAFHFRSIVGGWIFWIVLLYSYTEWNQTKSMQ